MLGLALLSACAGLSFGASRGPAEAPDQRVSAQTDGGIRLYLPIGQDRVPSSALATPARVVRATRTARVPTASPSPIGEPSLTPTPVATATPEEPPSPTVTPAPAPGNCDSLPSFEDGLTPSREIYVATDGDDAAGDGSPARPYRTIERAAREARPGTAIRLRPGRYAGGSYVEGLRGIEGGPIWLGGLPGEPKPVIEGGDTGLHLLRPRWLILHDLVVRGASQNGVNVDDGGDVADPDAAHHLIFRALEIQDVGSGGNQDCLKLSGLREVLVRDSQFARCGGGGSGIDMVGVHDSRIARNRFEAMGANAIQAKGGSRKIEIRWNQLRDAGQRAVNMGGSTGFAFFRPPLDPGGENAEAREIRLVANVIEGGDTPWAFVGCVDCLAAHNTVIEPQVWLMRVLQETVSGSGFDFAPAGDGRVINNLFVFRRGQLRSDVNVGGGTAPETFRFENNLWYAVDEAGRSTPQLPVPESGGIVGRDPLLRADRSIPADSPAAGAGLPGAWVAGDLAGRCWSAPPAIGAFEAP